MRLSGTFTVESVEEVGGSFAVELVRKSGMGNLQMVMHEEPEVGEEFDFVLKSRE